MQGRMLALPFRSILSEMLALVQIYSNQDLIIYFFVSVMQVKQLYDAYGVKCIDLGANKGKDKPSMSVQLMFSI